MVRLLLMTKEGAKSIVPSALVSTKLNNPYIQKSVPYGSQENRCNL